MKIVVAVDGSAFTRKAIDYIAVNRRMFVEGNELLMVHVCTGIPGHVTRHIGKDVLQAYYAEEGAKVIEPVKAQLAAHDIGAYSIELRHGYAPEEILRAANAAQAGLIVMGTHGHGIFGRALMGSVATKVIAEADISVLLVQ